MDRCLPPSIISIRGLNAYIESEKTSVWLFNGKDQVIQGRAGDGFDSKYSQRGVKWAVKQARKDADIPKEMTVHTLRHT